MYQLSYQQDGNPVGQLSLKKSPWLLRLPVNPSVISIAPAETCDSEAIASYIAGIYAKSYGAKIQVDYPYLASVQDDEGNLLAALGFRPASEETLFSDQLSSGQLSSGQLFLEQYLSEPIESLLHVPRNQIVEIGNLASSGGGASLFLFAAMSAYLHCQGYTQAVVTSTALLEKRFKQMGLSPKRLAMASPELLQEQSETWGSYYATDPHVLAGSVSKGYQRLQRLMGADYRYFCPQTDSYIH